MRVLMIGGTGPTGVPIVRDLIGHGHDVTILHRGTHERPETPDDVVHVHADPFDEALVHRRARRRHVGRRRRDVRPAPHGRAGDARPLRSLRLGRRRARVSRLDRTRGVHEPVGLPVPVSEDAPLDRRSRDRREGLPHRPHRGGRVRRTPERRALPLPVPVRAVPTGAARVVGGAPHPRRPATHRRRRRRSDAPPPLLHRELRRRPSCSRSSTRERSAGTIFNIGDDRGAHDPADGRAVRDRAGRRPRARVDAVRPRGSGLAAARAADCRRTGYSTSRACSTQLGHRDAVPAAAGSPPHRALARRDTNRNGAASRSRCSPTRSTTPPRTRSSTAWLAGPRLAWWCPSSRSRPAAGSPTADRTGGRARTKEFAE